MSQSLYEEGFSNKEFNDIFNNTLMQYRKTCNGLLLVKQISKLVRQVHSQKIHADTNELKFCFNKNVTKYEKILSETHKKSHKSICILNVKHVVYYPFNSHSD